MTSRHVRYLAALVDLVCLPLAVAVDWIDRRYANAINRPEDEA